MDDNENQEIENNWRRIYLQAIVYWQVLRKQTHPKHSSIYYNRMQLKVIGNYPSKEESCTLLRRIWHFMTLVQINVYLITLIWALSESTDSLVEFGEDLLWITAATYLSIKWHYLYFYADRVDEVVDLIDECHREKKNDRAVKEIRDQQRNLFLLESTFAVAWHIGVFIFVVLAILQPIWTHLNLPFHAIFPFDWHKPEKHPIMHAVIYVWQSYALSYSMISVLYFDLLSAHMFLQLGSNLKILCMELRGLTLLSRDNEELFRREFYKLIQFHQRIIGLVNLTNHVFYCPMIMQLITAFLLISLSTFISLVARNDLSVAARFGVLMILSFLHLSYWCIAGNMVTEQSQNVALAAYSVYEWAPYKREIQRDIIFLMQRAQVPLSMTASPFPPFNLHSYMAILKHCYTILTVLLESMD